MPKEKRKKKCSLDLKEERSEVGQMRKIRYGSYEKDQK
jgi:hypothetical protein